MFEVINFCNEVSELTRDLKGHKIGIYKQLEYMNTLCDCYYDTDLQLRLREIKVVIDDV